VLDGFGRGWLGGILVVEWDFVPDTLVWAAGVVMLGDLFDNALEMRLAEQDEVVESLASLPDEAFRVG
jgi:hypothetical protein